MRTLKELLPKKRTLTEGESIVLDEKTLFYICKKVLVEEYGVRGGENIIPVFYKEKHLFLAPKSSLWGNEVWLQRESLKRKINALAGTEAIVEIKIAQER